MKIVLIAVLLLGGCISNQCLTRAPADIEIKEVEMLDNGLYAPWFKVILLKKNRTWAARQKTLRHELCHVTEWQECLQLGALTGYSNHTHEERKVWETALGMTKHCKELN